MLKAVIYKEWLKTRNVFLLGLLLALCMTGYDILNMNRVSTMHGVEHIWQIMLMKDNVFVNHLCYLPLIAGIGIGLSQMIPEMSKKRLKLTLHLPYPQQKMIFMMLMVGFAELLFVSLIMTGCIAIYDYSILAPELVHRVVITMLPWIVCGINAYFLTVSICLEGCRLQRVWLALIGVAVVSWYFMQDTPEAYNGIVIPLGIVSLLCSLLVYRSVLRFKEGLQD